MAVTLARSLSLATLAWLIGCSPPPECGRDALCAGPTTGSLSSTATGRSTLPTGSPSGTPVGLPGSGTTTATDRADRIVLMGDSWSSGLVNPLRDAMDDGGFTDVELSWEFTANAGSTAHAWVANEHPESITGGPDTSRPRMLDALRDSLQAHPEPDAVVMVLGGNDFNEACTDGWGERNPSGQLAALTAIQSDLQTVVDLIHTQRPGLPVVLVGYDYFHHEFLVNFITSMPGLDVHSHNLGLVALDAHRKAIADADGSVHYVQNFGLLQHTYGDGLHPPFSVPNPLLGLPEYAPGDLPAPGGPPNYQPFPGGDPRYPAPLDQMPDGLHPTPAGFRVLADNVMAQALADLLTGSP